MKIKIWREGHSSQTSVGVWIEIIMLTRMVEGQQMCFLLGAGLQPKQVNHQENYIITNTRGTHCNTTILKFA